MPFRPPWSVLRIAKGPCPTTDHFALARSLCRAGAQAARSCVVHTCAWGEDCACDLDFLRQGSTHGANVCRAGVEFAPCRKLVFASAELLFSQSARSLRQYLSGSLALATQA